MVECGRIPLEHRAKARTATSFFRYGLIGHQRQGALDGAERIAQIVAQPTEPLLKRLVHCLRSNYGSRRSPSRSPHAWSRRQIRRPSATRSRTTPYRPAHPRWHRGRSTARRSSASSSCCARVPASNAEVPNASPSVQASPVDAPPSANAAANARTSGDPRDGLMTSPTRPPPRHHRLPAMRRPRPPSARRCRRPAPPAARPVGRSAEPPCFRRARSVGVRQEAPAE